MGTTLPIETRVAIPKANEEVTYGSVPETGQLVEVRRRRFVVSDVRGSYRLTDDLPHEQPKQNLVSLTSVEDDALGEELQVVWEIEPGARVLERAGLPRVDGFDSPDRLDAFLHAVRWGAVTDADFDALQAPFRSGISIEDYQLDPVVRAIRMPRANLLIADDVGLGKTIEAGLVIQELLLRHRARSVLIVCPASLQLKWRDEMREKFGLEFKVVDTELLRELRRTRGIHTNPWTHFPRLIVSIDWLKRDTPMRMFRDALPPHPTYPRRFDILVVDEAHNVAPSGSGHYAVDSLRTKAIRTIGPHFEHRLFLTATPHNGYQESFTALLELLDDQRFARGVPPEEEQLGAVMVRRLKTDITDADGNPVFPKRVIQPIEVRYTDEELEVHRLLNEYTASRRRAREENGGRYATEFVLKLLKKRLFSSPAAFAATLEKHRSSLTAVPEEEPESIPEERILRRAIEETEEEYADDTRYEDALDEAVEAAAPLVESLSDREREILDQLSEWADTARNRVDSKAEALLRWLDEKIRPGGEWTENRVILFTEYRATQNWLLDILARHGYTEDDRLATIYGGMDSDDREAIKAAFQAGPMESDLRILLATDAASEGIDLQNHCNLMIHLEIPWNPNRLEQRNGRIDRHGQRQKKVFIHHFVGEGWEERAERIQLDTGDLRGDLEFLWRAALKVDKIRQDLGRVGPVIAEQVESAMLRGGGSRLDTEAAEKRAAGDRKILKTERNVRERIKRLHERLLETQEKQELNPGTVRHVVEVALDLVGQPPLEPTTIPGAGPETEVFEMPAFRGTWQRCTEGLVHPHTGKRRPVTFDHSLIEGRDDVVLLHLRHRLVQMCLRVLRGEIWAPDVSKRLHRTTVRTVSDDRLDSLAVVAHARLLVIGESRHRLHEEIIYAGGKFREGRFRRFDTIGDMEKVLEASRAEMARELADLQSAWSEMEGSVEASLEARRADRMQHLESTLERRRDKEIEDMKEILEELRETIRREIDEPEDEEQIALWSDAELEQRKRDVQSLRVRMESIPEEIEKEERAIRKRYQNPQSRMFPVSLTFLVPESMNGGS